MKFYLAPLEGVTHYMYRNAYHAHFKPMDKYFTPFISAHPITSFSNNDLNEILPKNNKGLNVIPQILTNKAADFLGTAEAICQYGYEEINLNLGCPSKTVVSKNKGSGFLIYRDELNAFLETIFEKATMKISIKTRLGKFDADEFYELVKIYNQYPLEELIIHPRVQRDMYKNTPNLEVFGDALSALNCPVCYNGDIFSLDEYQALHTRFPNIDTFMLGRGVIGNPGLLGLIQSGTAPPLECYRSFHDMLFSSFKEVMHSERYVLAKMKEQWFYMVHIFTNCSEYYEAIKICSTLEDYLHIVNTLFENEQLVENPTGYRNVVNIQNKKSLNNI